MERLKKIFNFESDWEKVNNPTARNITTLLVSLGETTVGEDTITIENYPFEPASIYPGARIHAAQISEISPNSYPPSIRIKDELIFCSAKQLKELEAFAHRNNINITEYPMIWEWILKPFLDTEYTADNHQRTTIHLESYGLDPEYVHSIRNEVHKQMMTYNFDTMLWEWCSLGAPDVLKAMQAKYNKEAFRHFYEKVMRLALLTPSKSA